MSQHFHAEESLTRALYPIQTSTDLNLNCAIGSACAATIWLLSPLQRCTVRSVVEMVHWALLQAYTVGSHEFLPDTPDSLLRLPLQNTQGRPSVFLRRQNVRILRSFVAVQSKRERLRKPCGSQRLWEEGNENRSNMSSHQISAETLDDGTTERSPAFRAVHTIYPAPETVGLTRSVSRLPCSWITCGMCLQYPARACPVSSRRSRSTSSSARQT